MSTEQYAAVMMRVTTEAQYGDGKLIETLLVGARQRPEVSMREVPVKALYPAAGPRGEDKHFMDEELKFRRHLEEHGMRQPYVPAEKNECCLVKWW